MDAFGITQFYPSAAGDVVWDSQHWANGVARPAGESVGDRDSYDPTGWSQQRGSGSPVLDITGDGRLQMSGGQPRLYINAYPDGSDDKSLAEHLFTDVEITGYFRRLSTAGANWGGFVIGARSGPLGHGSPGGDNCDATTYYSRLRNDGDWQFAKELRHSAASVVRTVEVWPEAIPTGQWIGLKYVVYTLDSGAVRLQTWIDLTEGAAGGDWQLLGEYDDNGVNWNEDADFGSLDASGCSYDVNYAIAPGNGTVFIRNTDGDGEYKWVTVREIQAPS